AMDKTGIRKIILEERLNEEKVDEPSAPDDIQKDTNEDQEQEDDIAMPAPQVKVGPDGQIILDEKSLVIETTGTKKSREDLANSAVIVDYGNGSTGYGTYSKKNKKSKEWSKEETLKFYRALNMVGTDFSLMKSIFPKRTRRDLKTKYKKEDRLNRYLVEKALLNPLTFDLTELEKELEMEEEREREELREKALRKLIQKAPKRTKNKSNMQKTSFCVRSMIAAGAAKSDHMKKQRNNKRKEQPEAESKQVKRPRTLKNSVNKNDSSLSSDEENELNYDYENELRFSTEVEGDDLKGDHDDTSDIDMAELEFLTRPPKPTRSGRIPQPRKLIEIEDAKVTNNRKKESNSTASKLLSKNIESQSMPLDDLTNNLKNIEPGSIVVLATQSPTHPGHQVYKVFMVAPNYQRTQNLPENKTDELVELVPVLPA
ncbi:hypothetical protein L9F63_017471, partial [Diploptera punctata]